MIIDELFEAPQQCPECGGISFSDLILAEKKDACYHKVKASAKVWPSAYASGRLVQCRKKGAANYGNKSEGVAEGLSEARNSLFTFVKQQFPTWPDYVLKDFLYQQAKGIRDQAELDDFLKRNKQDFGNCKWTLTKLPITFDIFTPKTQRMLASREGGSSNPFQVPRDAERHAQQSQMIQQKGVSAEPIIVAKLSNGYDLIEGWHRTIQHLKAFPQGYTGPAWVCTGATYKSESVEQGVAEGVMYGAENLNVGDDVIISGDVEFNGATGVIDRFGQDKRFVVVDLYNHGPHSFHSSDVSANDYDNDEHDDLDEATPAGSRRGPLDLPPLEGPGGGGGGYGGGGGGGPSPFRGMFSKPRDLGTTSQDIATQRSVGGKEIPSLGQAGKVVTSPTANQALTKLGGKNVSTTSGPTVTVQKRGSEYEPLAVDVPAYVRQGKPNPSTTPKPGTKLTVKVRPGETMDQAVQRTKAEQEFGKFLQGQGGQKFGTAGAGRGSQGGPTASQATSGANQVPTIKLPGGQTIPDPARLSPSGQYNTQSGRKSIDQIERDDKRAVDAMANRARQSVADREARAKKQSDRIQPVQPSWKNRDTDVDLEETSRKKREQPEVEYDDEYDAMVARVKKLAGLGPMKTVYDPKKRQYRNMPTAQQPKR
jgi:hypothetical protein